jgi:hypothetical protein
MNVRLAPQLKNVLNAVSKNAAAGNSLISIPRDIKFTYNGNDNYDCR